MASDAMVIVSSGVSAVWDAFSSVVNATGSLGLILGGILCMLIVRFVVNPALKEGVASGMDFLTGRDEARKAAADAKAAAAASDRARWRRIEKNLHSLNTGLFGEDSD